ncbi:class I SAM-dependent methyltransferase [Parerythrobacter aestuarii]|uniref:class I SAM-dependent methyltransferase n=1 Tax=Parerythrobacter aestuarii TaxID=3020909 RepID=UPI0024DE4E77|nr:class I SAM-dependent methyltransferase [Parerythrobacter aestuarii]
MAERDMEDWQGKTGDRWLANIDSFEGMLSLLHRRLAETIDPASGETILDVGCGGGPLSLLLAEKVGPEGHVTGLDIAPQLIELARKRASAAGHANLAFATGDASSATPASAPYDRIVSAFGVMFFDDTAAAFGHLHAMAKPGAGLNFYAWAAPDLNPWMGIVMGTMSQFVELPERDMDGPGPFRLCDTAATTAMLEGAGFSDVSVETIEQLQPLGGPGASLDDAADFVMSALDVGAMMDEQGVDRAAPMAALKEALAPFAGKEGVMLPGCVLYYSATA